MAAVTGVITLIDVAVVTAAAAAQLLLPLDRRDRRNRCVAA